MIKTIPPRSYPDLDGLAQVEPVKVASAGLRGLDFSAFTKRAGHPLALWVRDHPPAPGEQYVHSHIFGVTERVGLNRNADGYGIKMARSDLPTYETHGRAYANHKSSDKSKAFGVVKKAYLNEEMGRAECIVALNATKEAAERNGGITADRTLNKLASGVDVAISQACFPPGEPVLMADGTTKPIELVGHGDTVVTHLGNVRPVGHHTVIPYDGTVVRFRASGIPGRVTATADHKVWVRPANGAEEGWRRADELTVGDRVRTPLGFADPNATADDYVDGAFLYRPVTETETDRYTGPVYNFSVEGDESYVVRLVAVKNCKIAHDVCTGCGNVAVNRGEYCDHTTCKYGGCKANLGRVFEDGHHLGRDNPVCTFFDWSDVSDTRGADRTAFITGKVAVADHVVGGAELAEMFNLVPPDHLLDPSARAGLDVARTLAKAARANVPHPVPDWDTVLAVRYKVAGQAARQMTFGPTDFDRQRDVLALAAGGVILPPDIWLSAVTGVDPVKCAGAMAGGLDPAAFVDRPDATDLLAEWAVTAGPRHALAPTPKARGLETQAAVLGARKRASASTLDRHSSNELKARYLAYQCATLAAHKNSANFDLLLSECVGHNR